MSAPKTHRRVRSLAALSGMLHRGALLCALLSALDPSPAHAQQPSAAPVQLRNLTDISLEDLTQTPISVTSFGRHEEDLWKTPAAVFVITREAIERSAASSIPELLRMVPGVQVAQIDASTWAVSIRGFNSALANKLLVLLDGRTVYSEAYSGTQWDQIDLPLDDIERIEVVRGPGGAIWGTNAVNGVINIITRTARSETGLRLSTTLSGVEEKLESSFGGDLTERTAYRAYASFHSLRPLPLNARTPAFDGENSFHAGGHLNWNPGMNDTFTLSGDLYTGTLKSQLTNELQSLNLSNNQENESLGGGYLLTRWRHQTRDGDYALQFSLSDQTRHELGADIRTLMSDLDFQNHTRLGSRNDLVWGADLRFTSDRIAAVVLPILEPHYFNPLGGAFLQDEISLFPDRLLLTLGARVEDGTLAGFQFEPTARLLWAPTPNHSLFAAISRSAVSPSLQNTAINLNLSLGTYEGLPVTGRLTGNPDYKPETVTAYELGYRTHLSKALTLDLAAFYNSNFRVQSLSTPSSGLAYLPTPHIDSVLLYGNGFQARSQGIEATLSSNPLPNLFLQASYAWMQSRSTQVEAGVGGLVDTWNTPRTSVSSSASWAFAPRWTLNGFLSHIGPLPPIPIFSPGASVADQLSAQAYTRIDLHLARRLGSALVFNAGVTNLSQARHAEFGPGTSFTAPAVVPRSAFVKGTWTF